MAEEQNLGVCCQPTVAVDAPVLILGLAPDEFGEQWPNADTTTPSGPLVQRYELAVLIDPLNLATTDAISSLLASARDQWARQVLVLVPLHLIERTTEQDYFALGFSHRLSPKLFSANLLPTGFRSHGTK